MYIISLNKKLKERTRGFKFRFLIKPFHETSWNGTVTQPPCSFFLSIYYWQCYNGFSRIFLFHTNATVGSRLTATSLLENPWK